MADAMRVTCVDQARMAFGIEALANMLENMLENDRSMWSNPPHHTVHAMPAGGWTPAVYCTRRTARLLYFPLFDLCGVIPDTSKCEVYWVVLWVCTKYRLVSVRLCCVLPVRSTSTVRVSILQ